MRILGIIPARGGSKGIPGKNIKLLAGKPLIAYTFESAKEAKSLTKIVVSTDNAEIARTCASIGLEVPFMRPDDLATDKSPTLPVIKHALDFFSARGESFDAVCLLQVTSPFRAAGFIDQALAQFEKSRADALVSVIKVPHEYNPHWVFEPNSNGFLKISTGEKDIISRRQDLPEAFIRDGAIYITKVETLMEKKSLYGENIAYLINNSKYHANLDTMEDWQKAEEIAPRFLSEQNSD